MKFRTRVNILTGGAKFNFGSSRVYWTVGLLVFLELANTLLIGSPLNLAITFPEVVYVFFLLFVKK